MALVTAALYGEIDHHIAPQIRGDIDAQCEHSRPSRLVLDFGKVGFMDSSGIGVLLGRLRKLSARGGSLSVKGMRPSVEKLFRLSGLDRVIGIMDSRKAGRA